jgi:protein involved in polysaccharide export with SLBB domain
MDSYDGVKIRRQALMITSVILFLICIGCQGVQPAVKQEQSGPESVPTVTLGPGDTIEVKFFHNPELNDAQVIRPDGKITLQLVGEIMVRGKTPAQLRDELKVRYAPELRTPEIAVIVRTLYDRRVYVGGEVKNPGLVAMPGPLTALEAVIQVGGFDLRTANLKNIIIIRHKNGNRYGAALDLTSAIKGKEFQPFYLEPRDIVYVPRTNIAKVNLWIDQYINKLVPRTGFVFSYPMGSGTVILDTSTQVAVP